MSLIESQSRLFNSHVLAFTLKTALMSFGRLEPRVKFSKAPVSSSVKWNNSCFTGFRDIMDAQWPACNFYM